MKISLRGSKADFSRENRTSKLKDRTIEIIEFEEYPQFVDSVSDHPQMNA